MVEPYTVAVPAGIGDSLWAVTKLNALRAVLDNEGHEGRPIEMVIAGGGPHRSADFLNAFQMIDSVRYDEYYKVNWGVVKAKREYGYINYKPSGFGYEGFDLTLIPNCSLECGIRLEDWFTELDTDFTIGKQWVFERDAWDKAKERMEGRRDYVVFYLGPELGNKRNGHNRDTLWSMQDWIDLANHFVDTYDVDIVMVGAPYDRSYTTLFMRDIMDTPLRDRVINIVGQTSIQDLYACCVQSKCVISYQAGVGIFSVYLGVPTVLWWRPFGNSITPNGMISFHEDMASAWAPPWSLENGRYLPQIYTKSTPESIAATIKERSWFDLRREIEFTDTMTLTDIGEPPCE